MNYALNHYWCETTILPALDACGVQSFNINKSMHGTNSVSHMLVTSGLLCGSVGEVARCDLRSYFQFPRSKSLGYDS